MAKSKKTVLQRLQLNHAYGQLVAFIFIPILFLAGIGTFLVIQETQTSAKEQQRYAAIAILARYQHTAHVLLQSIKKDPSLKPKAEHILQRMLSEQFLQRVSIVDASGQTQLTLGQRNYLAWPKISSHERFIGPIPYHRNTIYGASININKQGDRAWLLIELDNEPLEIARYRILTVLIMTGFITLLLLFMCLSFYSQRWIAPLYEMRMQLQQINADNLDEPVSIRSSGELKLLQQDIESTLKRLHFSFLELRDYTEQTEDDLRRTLDTLEVQNITYRQARDQAISANQSKSVFLANISHELRTPLNSIDGFIHLMLRQSNLTNDQNIYLQTIRKSSAHLLALINDVLDFSKIDAGKLELEMAPFHIEEAMFDVMDMLSPLAAQKNIQMAFYYAPDLPSQGIGDPLRFKQILTNLISNAIKFTPEGEIIVRARIQEQNRQQFAMYISVQDSGIGIHENDRNKLFDSFSQVDTSITRQFGGTGLGLAISKQLVQMMHGEIGFENNQELTPTEKGSTFWFTALFEREQNSQLDLMRYPSVQVLSFISHAAAATSLRLYLEYYQVQHKESASVLDLLGELNQIVHYNDLWVIVDHSGNTQALLQEIRRRYHGKLAVYGYQMALDPEMMSLYHATPLYQPLSRQALLQLLTDQFNNKHELATQQFFDGQGLHVLAVDDHMPNLSVLEALLGELNVKTTKALSGQDALNLIKQNIDQQDPPYDLVFMDIQMPVMSGIDTTRAIRSLESTLTDHNAFPVIALTAHALSDEKERLLAVGMNDYVTKPIQIEQLIQILTTWTSNRFTQPHTKAHDVQPSAYETDSNILNWSESVRLAAHKEELALDLLHMLVDSFDNEIEEMRLLIELEDFPQLEHVLHRLYGATRYVGTPKLQHVTGEFEQFISTLRKEKRKADSDFVHATLKRFNDLKTVIEQTRVAAKHKLNAP